MKLTTFLVFAERVRNLEFVLTGAMSCDVFRWHEGSWWDEHGSKFTDPERLPYLNTVRINATPYYRPRRKTKTYFGIPQLDCVVEIDFTTALRQEKQRKFLHQIEQCYSNSKNEFDAKHDALTLLPNRVGYEQTLSQSIAKISAPATIDLNNTVKTKAPGLTLFSFDVDHFKQINDTFGHSYGDVVLAAFAWRLDSFASELQSRLGTKVSIGRLGGEEFQLYVEELLDTAEAENIAERFRALVANDPLPSSTEWANISPRQGLSDDRLPLITERKVTISTGYSFLPASQAITGKADLKSLATGLINEADTALYRAKADGRNCSRSFRDIRDKLGRILEHHDETAIVTIDIGSAVGVKDGTEFLVFHPQFTGDVPFVFSDGRTRRTLGTYPRYVYGRITAFKVQREISFCSVQGNDRLTRFPVGSRLEYVPLGSITHLVDSDDPANSQLNDYSKLVEQCSMLSKSERTVVAVSASVKDIERIVAANGNAVTNEMLASFYSRLRKIVGEKALIATTGTGQFAVVADRDTVPGYESLLSSLKSIPGSLKFDPYCQFGIFDSSQVEFSLSKPEIALECASIARHHSDIASYFDNSTPSQVVQAWRADRRLNEAIADYERFKSFGIAGGALENSAGLCYLEMRPQANLTKAIECFGNAIELEPDVRYYTLNLAFALSANGEHRLALEIAASDIEERIDLLEDVYAERFAVSAYALRSDSNPPIGRTATLQLYSKAIATLEKSNPELMTKLQSELVRLNS